MVQFSTNEAVSLEKQVDNSIPSTQTAPGSINSTFEIDRCVNWIKENNFRNVCLQFPDFLLPDSTEVAMRLQSLLGQTVYVLGDTTYESCCIDYVSAAHVNADAIVHYGPTCFSKSSDNVPCLYVYEKKPLDVSHFKEVFCKQFSTTGDEVTVLLDSPYVYYLDALKSDFCSHNLKVLPIDTELMKSQNTVFICDNHRKVLNLMLALKSQVFYYYNPANPSDLINYEEDPKMLRKRYFLVEKIKDSNTIGIVIGTLAVKNYLEVIERMKKLISHNHKKYYVISVGKPTIAKLANFPELDVYVMISCAMSNIYDSRDFYKPIVTPYDVELALNPKSHELKFSYDYNSYLAEDVLDSDDFEKPNPSEPDISLITGKIRGVKVAEEPQANGSQLMLKNEGTLALSDSFGAGFLGERSWKGLEQNLGRDEPELAAEGRRGIAQGYENEES